MKIRSLLLGSIAATGLAASGYAADLGVVTSLDVCDELGLSGLTISSDDNCLQITGNVSMEYSIGDYGTGTVYVTFSRTGGTYSVNTGNGTTDADLDIDAWLKFVATADSDFGPATATIKLLVDSLSTTADPAVVADEAWVGIGDTTMLMAGHKSSIFNDGDDAPLNYLGLFNSSNVDAGVGFATTGAATGGNVIQVVSNLGNGLSIGGAVEDLQTSSPAIITGVGVISYAGDGISAHASGALDAAGAWKFHAGFKGTWDPITIVGAVAADDTGWWNVLGSASATFDMFTLAASAEATVAGEWGVGGSLSAAVTDGVTLNLGGRYFSGAANVYQVEAGVSAAVTETITLTAAVGAEDSTIAAAAVYGKAGLAWAPGGGFTASIAGEANTLGAYKATFKAAKSIK
ncbi:MAG: hypothetical protein HY834_13885 [Devosia nanyangense]|uniref:Porin n=1 Tax=Devosia nanyangense TaxID=1228055 RepID=A0A933L464_9HYPH|nr:hypothetical protein [Devosia nanyangense]